MSRLLRKERSYVFPHGSEKETMLEKAYRLQNALDLWYHDLLDSE